MRLALERNSKVDEATTYQFDLDFQAGSPTTVANTFKTSVVPVLNRRHPDREFLAAHRF